MTNNSEKLSVNVLIKHINCNFIYSRSSMQHTMHTCLQNLEKTTFIAVNYSHNYLIKNVVNYLFLKTVTTNKFSKMITTLLLLHFVKFETENQIK